jgi:hypothetical protein
MDAHTSSRRTARFRLRVLTAILVGVALGVAAFFVVRALTGSEDNAGKLEGPDDTFTLSYPDDWAPLSKEELEKLPGSPLAVVRRKDRKGIVIINAQGRVTRDLDKFSRQLDRKLKGEIPDFGKVSSRSVTIKAGRAFLYTYIRKRRGTVQIVVAVPVGPRGYTLNAVVQGGAEDVARQVGAMIRSFDA